jgi:flagellar hook-length control protein FliK
MIIEGNMQGIKGKKNIPTPKATPALQLAYGIKKSTKATKLTVNLYPKHLGKVTLDISLKGDSLVAHFKTDTVQAKESLQMNMHILRDALVEKGSDVENMEFDFYSREGHQGGGHQEQQQEKEENRKDELFSTEDDEIEEIDFFREAKPIDSISRTIRSLGMGILGVRV